MSTEIKDDKRKVVEIEIRVKEFERKKDKVKFLGYKGLNKDGFYIDIKFTKAVEKKDQPTENCIIVCNVEDVNYYGKDRVKYPYAWVKGIKEIKPVYNPESNKETDDLPF
jgi:hypothetical protein